jgi:hypothetical protein
MDWGWLEAEARLRDRQNRLAYVVKLAADALEKRGDGARALPLRACVGRLERARLAMEDTLCKASMTQAELRWLRVNRPAAAAHWNLLTDLVAAQGVAGAP